MFNSHEQQRSSSPTPDAYEGSWLELLENPDAGSLIGEAGGSSEPPAYDAGNGFGASSFGSSD
jgi:hypothetical protein